MSASAYLGRLRLESTQMKLEAQQVKRVCETLRKWGHEITDAEVEDLVAEFDVIKRKRERSHDYEPDTNHLGSWNKGSIDTARQAALSNYPRSGSQRHRVLVAIVAAGERGLTREETSRQLNLPDSGTDGRVLELKQGGWVEDTERRRKTERNCDAAVVVATAKGREWVRKKELTPV